jgi:hypothetical protein
VLGAPFVAPAPAGVEALPVPPVGLALVWVRLEEPAGLLGVLRCLCRTSTVRPSPEGSSAGVEAGGGGAGTVVVVVEGVVAVLVKDAPEPVGAPASGVVEAAGGSAPVPVVVEPGGASAPRAPPARGPPIPAIVSPPPASADSMRHDRRCSRGPRGREAGPRVPRKPLIGGLLGGWWS